ncbi:glycosyltransferase family 4 protein [Daldinia caldariorum]|uniref:glycosyltransferase family 4 protein n=1 Tax=Daldinia caldariorum TaxID=326644 RepID=UPI0020081454|nr:glycosyltransferase family 4 protein [Daldinia caldariorum]KAI1471145.1 glycosyltransferase family 4 protein [Daldinia caldariorum]
MSDFTSSSSCSVPSKDAPYSFGMESKTLAFTAIAIACTPFAALVFWNFILPLLCRIFALTVGSAFGWCLRKSSEGRRSILIRTTAESEARFREAKAQGKEGNASSDDESWENIDGSVAGTSGNGEKGDRDWDGIVGFFHPFCNAGGGGERVLWAAVRATQKRWPNAKIVVYTGDHEVIKDKMLSRVKNTFSIDIHPPTIHFIYLTTRHWVLSSTWPHMTLLGQSVGSLIMGLDAFSLLVPDIFVDTMGYAFVLGLSKILFPTMPTAAYVHYPTISTDMLDSLDPKTAVGNQGVNAGKGVGVKGALKKHYWKIFAAIYSWMGASVDVVMTNSSWTQGHIESLWGPRRNRRGKKHPIAVVYPPCAVNEIERAVEISEESEKRRQKYLVYIAQFRPEKNHQLILQSFAEFVKTGTPAAKEAKLVLLGSVRGDDDSKRVYTLRLLVNELQIKDQVIFQLDAPWSEILQWLGKAFVGVNGMWNEHFGIGVVEYLAAGLISVVHNSGGPKLDIVVDVDGQPTGFHASTTSEFADGFEKALSHPDPLSVRRRARLSSKRFTEEEFAKKWLSELEKLVAMKL